MSANQKWLLPDGVLELLPNKAEQLEQLRRSCIDLYRSWGYQLVYPPLMEYLESLLTGSDPDLALRTLKVTDQISGRLMGIRADITPQVARIDAHALSQNGLGEAVNRLCYVGSVLHAMPQDILAPRTFVQTGVELYGDQGALSDQEALEIMIETFQLIDPKLPMTINVGHVGLFNHVLDKFFAEAERQTSFNEADRLLFIAALKRKNLATLTEYLSKWNLPKWEQVLGGWVFMQGGLSVLTSAARLLPKDTAFQGLLNSTKQVLEPVAVNYPHVDWFVDLSEVQSYAYHTGLVYAAYPHYSHTTIAGGGRYDGLGCTFGRSRPATGFSADLLALVELKGLSEAYEKSKSEQSNLKDKDVHPLIWAPVEQEPSRNVLLKKKVKELRLASKPVVLALSEKDQPALNQSYLVFEGESWVLKGAPH